MAAPTTRARLDASDTCTLGELLDREFPPDEFIINEGLLPKGGLMFIGGPPKSYKSFVMNTMIFHLALGTNLFGVHRVHARKTELAFSVAKPQRILLLEQEIGPYDLRSRFLPMMAALPPDLRDSVRDAVSIRSRDYTMCLDTTEGLITIRESIERTKPNVICFDPFADFHNAEENSAREMTKVFKNLRMLQDDYGVAIIMSHHLGKPDANGAKSGPDMLRGSSVIFAKGDSYLILKVTNESAGLIKIDFTIRRDKPIRPIEVMVDWQDSRVKFYRWYKSKTEGLELSEQ